MQSRENIDRVFRASSALSIRFRSVRVPMPLRSLHLRGICRQSGFDPCQTLFNRTLF